MTAITGFVQRLIDGWMKFFFDPVSTLPLAMFRIVFAFNALIMYSIRLTDWKFYYTNSGIVPDRFAMEQLPEFFRAPVGYFFASDEITLALHILYLVVIVCFGLGIFSRVFAVLGLFIHLGFMQRNYGVAYGADIITSFWWFYFIFSESDRVLSLRAWWSMKKGRAVTAVPADGVSSWFTTIGLRLAQIQLCLIYGYTGLEKMKGPTWWEGTAVWAVIGNEQLSMFDQTWLMHIPLAVAFATYTTLIFEIYFPAIIWMKPIRYWVLAFGVALHMGIAISVGLVFFSFVMISSYFMFVDDKDLRPPLLRLGVSPRLLG